MKAKIIKTEDQNKGKYNLIKVTYLNTETGKPGSTNIVSFKDKELFAQAKALEAGTYVDATVVKEGDFFNWTKFVEIAAPEGADDDAPVEAAKPVKKAWGKSTPTGNKEWETRAERAARQVLIVRQSSITAAINVINLHGGGTDLKEILNTAEQIEKWVFRGGVSAAVPAGVSDAMGAIIDMADDIPE